MSRFTQYRLFGAEEDLAEKELKGKEEALKELNKIMQKLRGDR